MSSNAYTTDLSGYEVIHPLNDVAEAKCSDEHLGTIQMSRSVKISLFVLRAYLIAIVALAIYRFLAMSGLLHA